MIPRELPNLTTGNRPTPTPKRSRLRERPRHRWLWASSASLLLAAGFMATVAFGNVTLGDQSSYLPATSAQGAPLPAATSPVTGTIADQALNAMPPPPDAPDDSNNTLLD